MLRPMGDLMGYGTSSRSLSPRGTIGRLSQGIGARLGWGRVFWDSSQRWTGRARAVVRRFAFAHVCCFTGGGI